MLNAICLLQTICTIVAAALHYFYLAAFLWKLAYGVEVFLKIKVVFITGSRLTYYCLVGWGEHFNQHYKALHEIYPKNIFIIIFPIAPVSMLALLDQVI